MAWEEFSHSLDPKPTLCCGAAASPEIGWIDLREILS